MHGYLKVKECEYTTDKQGTGQLVWVGGSPCYWGPPDLNLCADRNKAWNKWNQQLSRKWISHIVSRQSRKSYVVLLARIWFDLTFNASKDTKQKKLWQVDRATWGLKITHMSTVPRNHRKKKLILQCPPKNHGQFISTCGLSEIRGRNNYIKYKHCIVGFKCQNFGNSFWYRSRQTHPQTHTYTHIGIVNSKPHPEFWLYCLTDGSCVR